TDKKLNIKETGSTGQSDKKNDEETHIDIFSGRTDAQIRLPLDFQLEPGAKFTFSRNNSNTRFTISDNERSSGYNYHEGVAAVYLLASKQFFRFRAQAGLRMEMSDMYAKTDGVVIQDERHTNLFPSASLDYQFHTDWSLNASYAKKITRPTFQDLNPAITYVDELSYSKGNPLLVPEIRNSFDLKLVYKGFASLGVSYTRAKNSFGWQVLQDEVNPDITCATQINVNRSDTYTVDLMLPYQNKHLTAYLSTGLIYTRTHDNRLDGVNLKRPMWYCYSGLDINLPWNLKLNTNVGYYSKGVVNVFTAEPMFRMDMGVSRRFLKDKLNVSLLWNDVFHSAKTSSYSMMSNRYLHYSFYNDQSFVQFSVSFSLNGIKNPFKSRSGIDEDRERIKGL
ncbi:MAG: outer membrane beta-barrel family protein, partial [Bacteroidales bacterium]|nr:outer membrane beta-barrel family protein [Bacteroidales bacterium]